MKNLSYPIGEFEMQETVDNGTLQSWISDITNLPTNLKALTNNLSIEQL